MTRIIWGLLAAGVALAQPNTDLKFFFNGAGVAMHTESSNKTSPLSTSGSVIVGDGPAHRVVLDKENRALFAYDIELRKLADGGVLVRIDPVNQESVRKEKWYPRAGAVPTISAARQFPPLRVGDEIQVDIMQRPATGEKLWDVLRVVEDRESYPGAPRGKNGFSFERVKVVIDGKTVVEERNSWMIGQAIKMSVPGRGDYYLAITPPSAYPFEASGWVDHNLLRFRSGGEQIEITSKSNLLQNSEYGTVWVYYLPSRQAGERRMKMGDVQITAPAGAAGVDFVCADSVEWLMPKDRRKEE